jgi:hypothetical protein
VITKDLYLTSENNSGIVVADDLTPRANNTRGFEMTRTRKTEKQAGPLPAPLNLTASQAAEYLGSTVWAVRELGWAKELKTIWIGRRLLFPVVELERYQERLLSGSTEGRTQ